MDWLDRLAMARHEHKLQLGSAAQVQKVR